MERGPGLLLPLLQPGEAGPRSPLVRQGGAEGQLLIGGAVGEMEARGECLPSRPWGGKGQSGEEGEEEEGQRRRR